MTDDRQPMPGSKIDLPRLKKIAFVRMLLGLSFFGLLFFLPAGTFRYWQAWTYMTILFVPGTGAVVCFFKRDPELLERRMRAREKEPAQKRIFLFYLPLSLAALVVPGLDRRFDWSSVPVAVVIISDVIIILGYCLFVRVLLENRYASRIIEVEQGQQLVTTGPYAVVRHPMYVAVSVMILFSPLALGSYWAMIPGALVMIPLIARIHYEEKALLNELEGYREYTLRTRYRLIPGVW